MTEYHRITSNVNVITQTKKVTTFVADLHSSQCWVDVGRLPGTGSGGVGRRCSLNQLSMSYIPCMATRGRSLHTLVPFHRENIGLWSLELGRFHNIDPWITQSFTPRNSPFPQWPQAIKVIPALRTTSGVKLGKDRFQTQGCSRFLSATGHTSVHGLMASGFVWSCFVVWPNLQ